ncbi:hypothetical protein KUTeg_017164 [Tegillarca granosa]|uniref:Uncharacterized protein n=1 Tax=Tegillarca granosa TaxID=220873 RepID=A0ABQ9EMX2_TEGGR|nr:hypothetical protein KUTeg_017164 [Tegillarca granosa]
MTVTDRSKMATTYIESDIDQFIRSQKAKLQQERNIIGGPQGKGGRGSGRKSWDKPQDNKYANQNDNRPESPEQQGLPLTNDKANQRRAELNKERQKEYNEILQNKRLGGQVTRRPPPSRDRRRAPREAARQSDVKVNVQRDDGRPRLRQKEVTPPYDGMKFGDFEEYRKRIEDQRKQEYKHDLEKQVEEKKRKEAEQKHKENVELASRHPYVPIDNELRRMQREEQRRKVYDRRLAEQNRKRDGDAHDLSPRSRSLSPVDPQYESYVEERLRREAEIRRQEEEALREAEARRAYEEQLTERELQRQQELLQRQRLESLEDEVKDNYKTPRGDPYRPPGLMPEERSKEYQRLTEQNPPKTSKQDSGNDEGGGFLKLGGYENKRKQLEEERHQDYLRFQQAQQNKKRDKRNSRSPSST